MQATLFLLIAVFLNHVVAGDKGQTSAQPAVTTWVEWKTEVSTVYSTYTKYITDTSISISTSYVPTTVTKTETEVKTVPTTVVQTVPTTIIQTVPTTVVQTVPTTVVQTVPTTINQIVPTTIVQNVATTVTQTVPTTIVQNSATTITQTVTTTVVQNSATTVVQTSAVVSVITTVSRNTITLTASTTCPSSLSGLVTCPSRIINPTYTPATPLPSTYLWGCPPGYLCYPERVNCNFEQNLPAQSYVCRPEECRPAAQIPDYDAFIAANDFPNRTDCAFYTPIDDYFNINPQFFGLDFNIFDIYGQPRCSATTTCPAAQAPETKTVTVVQAGSTWASWSGPAYTQAPSHVTSYASAPHVTPRAQLIDRQNNVTPLAQLIGYSSCYPKCNYAAAQYQSHGNDPVELCNTDGAFVAAYYAAQDCNIDWENRSGGGPSMRFTDLEKARSLCTTLTARRLFGRNHA